MSSGSGIHRPRGPQRTTLTFFRIGPWISVKGGEDFIIGKLCTEQCVGYLVECVAECNNDPVCISMCAREESKCVDSCPCHTDCMEGCFGCEHPLCNQVGSHTLYSVTPQNQVKLVRIDNQFAVNNSPWLLEQSDFDFRRAYSLFSVMVTLTKTKTFTGVKINLQRSLPNVLLVVVEAHHALLVARPITKMVSKTVRAWRAVRRDVPVRNGTVALSPFICFDLINYWPLGKFKGSSLQLNFKREH